MRTRPLFRVSLLLLSALIALPLSAQRTLIHAGSLIDGNADAVLGNTTITIDGGRITGVEDGFANPEGTDIVVDLKDATVMPGFIDLHVHLTGEQAPTSVIERLTSTIVANLKLVIGKRTVLICLLRNCSSQR